MPYADSRLVDGSVFDARERRRPREGLDPGRPINGQGCNELGSATVAPAANGVEVFISEMSQNV